MYIIIMIIMRRIIMIVIIIRSDNNVYIYTHTNSNLYLYFQTTGTQMTLVLIGAWTFFLEAETTLNGHRFHRFQISCGSTARNNFCSSN